MLSVIDNLKTKTTMRFFFFLFLSFSSFCQTYTLTGSVKDTSNMPIPLANVFTAQGAGILTNENGEFVLKVSSLPFKIFISHVSYQAVSIQGKDETPVKIILKEGIKTLSEVKVGSYALEIIKKAIEKANSDSIYNHFGKGFYRRIAKEENRYTVLHEIFFDGNFNSKYGIRNWKPTASRYTDHDGNFEVKGAYGYVFGDTSPSPRSYFYTREKGYLAIEELSSYYRFEIETVLHADTPNEIMVVSCKPRENFETSFTGRFYIKSTTYSVLRVVGVEKVIIPAVKNFWFKIKESSLDIDVQFREKDETVILSGIDAKLNLTVTYASSVNKQGIEKMQLVIYDYDKPKDNEAAQLQPMFKIKQDQIFTTTQGSPEFWENNPIIKRTPLEDEVIKSFEKKAKKKGGNMFPAPK